MKYFTIFLIIGAPAFNLQGGTNRFGTVGAQDVTCTTSGMFCHDCKTRVVCSPTESSFVPYIVPCQGESEVCIEESNAAICQSVTSDPSSGDCSCGSSTLPAMAEDPYQMSKFVVCLPGDRIVSSECPQGQIFADNGCKKSDSELNECTEVGMKAVPSDCTKYILCTIVNGQFQSETLACNEGEKFDESIPICTSDAITAPPPFNPKTCEEIGFVPDPIECNGYHFCTGSGTALNDETQCCPQGLLFSPDSLACVPDDGSISCPVVSSCADDQPEYKCEQYLAASSPSSNGTATTSDPSNSNSTTVGSNNGTCTSGDKSVIQGDCKKFNYCKLNSDGTTQWKVYTCPGSTLFSPIYLYCMKSSSVECN